MDNPAFYQSKIFLESIKKIYSYTRIKLEGCLIYKLLNILFEYDPCKYDIYVYLK
jgi:hypothetical protein